MKSWVLGPSEASSQGLGPVLDPSDLPQVRGTLHIHPLAQGVQVLYAKPVAKLSQSSEGRYELPSVSVPCETEHVNGSGKDLYSCCDCKKSFCSLCSVLQENLRICATCHLLKATAFQRPRLMRLRVKDLRQYLFLRNIPTDTCREKEDLVDLVLCHQGIEEEEDPDTGSLHSHSMYTPTPSTTQSASELSAFVISQEEHLSRSDSSDTNQDIGDATSVSLLNLDPNEHTPEVSPQTRCRARASLSDISSLRDIEGLSVRQLKEILARNFVNFSGCCEKWELVERVSRLYRETEENRKSLENVSGTVTTVVAFPTPICNGAIGDGEKGPLTIHDDNLCRICMDAAIDCVLLECGHMVTCTKCGKRMNECPICRQFDPSFSPVGRTKDHSVSHSSSKHICNLCLFPSVSFGFLAIFQHEECVALSHFQFCYTHNPSPSDLPISCSWHSVLLSIL
ncbi:E3 ubiquitin-protein ligase RNF34a isoform X3 [Channa argus]|uniref:E3 ubiquitin-protein ligase RNF34a isoform X3 n=1 Tax=Channa argus TaxID=215402 RepID=UPI00351F8D86